MATLPSIPSIPATIDQQTWQVLNTIKTNIDYLQKLPALIDSNQTAIEQTVANVIATVNGSIADNASLDVFKDNTPPIALDNLQVTAGILYNFLEWGELPGNADHVNIYRAAVNDRTQATVIGSSQVRIYADYIPEGVDTNYYYWLRAVSKAGIEGEWNLVNGAVSAQGTVAAPMGIGDSQVSTISATKIVALSLSAISANLGTITAGTITSPDNTFIIDLSDKSITISGPNGIAHDDYTLIKNGQVQFWKWTGSTHQQGNSLQTIESGTASNGATVTLSKWYKFIPNIIVTPNDMPIYSKDYSNQDQKLQIRAEDKQITAGGEVSFTAISRLVLSGANPSIPVNETYSGSSDSDTTNTITTNPTATRIQCAIAFSSFRGTGTAPNYNYRKVDARIVYRVSPSGSWNYTAWVTTNINEDFNTYTANLDTGTLASGTYDFYVEFLAADRGGTFANGSSSYTQSTVTKSLGESGVTTINGATTGSATYTFPSYSPPSGTIIDSIDYTLNLSHYLKNYGNSGKITKVTYNSTWENKIVTFPVSPVFNFYQDGDASLASNTWTINRTTTNTNYEENHGFELYSDSSDSRSTVSLKLISGSAVLHVRTPVANSTTPSNVFTLESYSMTLSSAVVIDSTGTLNWVAIA